MEELVEEGGVSILYTYLESQVVDGGRKGKVKPRVEKTLRRLAADGRIWFAPASDLLDRILEIRNIEVTRRKGRLYLESYNPHVVENVVLLHGEGDLVDGENAEGMVEASMTETVVKRVLPVKNRQRFRKLSPKGGLGALERCRLPLEQAAILMKQHSTYRPFRRWNELQDQEKWKKFYFGAG